MRISGKKSVSSTTGISGSKHKPVEKEQAPEVARSDDVAISDSVKEVEQAKEAVKAMPDVRVEKVDAIKPLVNDGSYEAPSEEVAKRMVDSSLRESAQQKKGSRGQ